MKKLGQYLKKKRMEAQLTQADVARFLGYKSAQHVSNWENGRQNPPNDALYMLIILYRMDEEEFIQVLCENAEVFFRSLLSKRKTGSQKSE